MKLTLLSWQEISSLTLPGKPVGQHQLIGRNSNGRFSEIISIEGVRSEKGSEGKWIAKSNRRFCFMSKDGEPMQSVLLEPLELYYIQSTDGKLRFTLFAEPVTADRAQFKGYVITQPNAVISIGRSENNCISYSNKFTSGNHAKLSFSNGTIILNDTESSNSTYVNGRALKQAQLSTGDVVYIMGLKIIVTPKVIFINNPDGNVKINSPLLCEFHTRTYQPVSSNSDDYYEFEELRSDFYYRALRLKSEITTEEIKIDPPPADQNNDEMPMAMVIGPSLTMGMASIASGIFSVVNALERGSIESAMPSLVTCLSMLLGTLMWPLITKTYQKRIREQKEIKRQETYTQYLKKLDNIIKEETFNQRKMLCESDYSLESCAARVLSDTPNIWERTPKHSDFLCIGLGIGRLPLNVNIQYSERRFSVEQDNLTEMMYNFGETEHWIDNVPVCLSLKKHYISGIYGNRNELIAYVKGIILQLATMYSYDEVKLVLLYDVSQSENYSFTRWLPHTMNNERTVRFIATNSEEAKQLSADLDSVIEYRKSLSDNKLDDEKEHYVILCLDKDLMSKTECVRRVLEHKNYIKFSIVSIFDMFGELPKECMAVVRVNGGSGNLTYVLSEDERTIDFHTYAPSAVDVDKVTNVLANTVIDINGSDYVLPKKYTFFEMLGIGMIEHLNISENWMSNDPTKSLAAVIGVDRYGEPFKLDLHESAHGPHGLVAGMTGSGKSEFIIAYILSMAVSFHPYEVAFILIDYKGGGMAKSFENIPHTAGVITNLDGNGIKRSLSSMRSELHRRERIFRETSTACNVSNIDIYKYQRLYREGKVGEPLPHLFIISDEFAELKKEQPDFMAELTSTARVGRSLGVHLILATQKPGGVVDDQIRSNSRFKVCLKVQDSGDSQEMLGRPDAASLVETGRFYLQVGYNEIFEIGQSAWAGSPYYPSQRVIKDRDDAVSIINMNGRVISEANTNRFAAFVDPPKQLDVVTDYISKYCESENIKRWKMWLDPIPGLIYVDELVSKYADLRQTKFELSPVVGEFDDPTHQKQDILRVPITKEGNVIVYGSAGNGKAMFIEAMCYSLMQEHTPSEVNIYIVDLGSETFTAFSESPFVGDVILAYETEKINNLLKLMLGKIETRKKLLSEFGENFAQYNSQAENPEPNIVVIINNYAAFTELFEDKTGEMTYLTREGTKYGIYFVLSCTGVNNVRFSMLQNFKLLYCLQMNNTDDYSSVVGKTEGLLPEKYKGRGIFRVDKDTLLEFQTACIIKSDSPYQSIREFCKKQAEFYLNKRAANVPVLPEKVTENFLRAHTKHGDLSRVPIGVEKSTLEISYFDFSASPISLALSVEQDWQSFSNALGILVSRNIGVKTIIFSPMGNNSENTAGDKLKICSDTESCVKAVNEIFNTMLRRNNEYKERLLAGEETPQYEPMFIVIQSMSLLKTMLERYVTAGKTTEKTASDDTPLNRLQLAMAKCEKEYNVHFLVCESLSAVTPFTVENWYKAHINPANGIWVGGGIGSQFRFTVNKKPADYSAELDSDFGFAINRSTAVLIKLLQQ